MQTADAHDWQPLHTPPPKTNNAQLNAWREQYTTWRCSQCRIRSYFRIGYDPNDEKDDLCWKENSAV